MARSTTSSNALRDIACDTHDIRNAALAPAKSVLVVARLRYG
jgi:hypothetical protein